MNAEYASPFWSETMLCPLYGRLLDIDVEAASWVVGMGWNACGEEKWKVAIEKGKGQKNGRRER